MHCGLLGRKLGHSYSPQIHSYLADYSYELFEKEPDELKEFLVHGDFCGLNVTIPYKKDVASLCDILSDRAQKLGAVNTVVRNSEGKLIGHNTDYFGFLSMLNRTGISVNNKKVLVLGSGGASVTAVAVLEELDANVIVISRTGENNYRNLYLHADASMIVNTTPVGMYPNVGVSPIDLNLFPDLEGVLDVIYNPARTQLLMDAEARGLITENGLWMLVAQAKESAEWFTGRVISDSMIPQIHQHLKSQMENIVLIGMPGCGKSSIGKLLAEKLNRKFIDIDNEIQINAAMTIPDIFSNYGEEEFRRMETEVLAEYGKQSGLVIATGGGCVTQIRNYPLLHQNGHIIWIQRDVDKLPVEGRPLSQKDNLHQMYRTREPMYNKFCDNIVINEGCFTSIVCEIIKLEESR